jgi:hypothetical protein
MKNSKTRLTLFSALLTLGIMLMSFGNFWLMCFGGCVCMLAAHFSSRPQSSLHRLTKFAIWGAIAVQFLTQDWHGGVTSVHRTPPMWFWLLLFAAWLWNLADAFFRWQKNRDLK